MSADLTPRDGDVVFVGDSGEPFTTSLVIADETGNQHASVIKLIRENADDMNDIGRVRFEIRPFETAGGKQHREVAELDEPASALLMTYLRNTPKVKDFKKRLVGGFYAMRQMLADLDATPADTRHRAELLTKADLARMVLEVEEEKAVMAAALESAAPMIAYHDRYISNDDAVLIEVWGAQFGLTRPQAFALLIQHKMIYRRLIMKRYSKSEDRVVEEYEHRAFARYLDWFDLRPQHNVARHHNGQVRQTLYVRQEFALAIAEKIGLSAPKLPGGAS